MKFVVKWPVTEALQPEQKQEELAEEFISIVAAFEPGTA
jgi:hypothetical protein